MSAKCRERRRQQWEDRQRPGVGPWGSAHCLSCLFGACRHSFVSCIELLFIVLTVYCVNLYISCLQLISSHPILLVNNGINFVLLRVLCVAAHYGQRTISHVISWLVIL